jgi:hypothetical protein
MLAVSAANSEGVEGTPPTPLAFVLAFDPIALQPAPLRLDQAVLKAAVAMLPCMA